MTSRERQVPEGVRDPWGFWLNDHTPLTLPPLTSIPGAVIQLRLGSEAQRWRM
jgi:hypothetical protein